MNKFAEKLKELRLEKNLTQTKLANDTGLSQAIIANWERNLKTPTLDNLIILAKYFGCSIDYLAGIED